MKFYTRARGIPTRLAIFPGAFNPPTLAHLAMAEAALSVVDEVLFVLPRVFPHKEYTAAGFDERLEMLLLAIAEHPRFSLAASDRGLFIDLAREARSEYDAELFLLCGRDAAERIVGWDYGDRGRHSGAASRVSAAGGVAGRSLHAAAGDIACIRLTCRLTKFLRVKCGGGCIEPET